MPEVPEETPTPTEEVPVSPTETDVPPEEFTGAAQKGAALNGGSFVAGLAGLMLVWL